MYDPQRRRGCTWRCSHKWLTTMVDANIDWHSSGSEWVGHIPGQGMQHVQGPRSKLTNRLLVDCLWLLWWLNWLELKTISSGTKQMNWSHILLIDTMIWRQNTNTATAWRSTSFRFSACVCVCSTCSVSQSVGQQAQNQLQTPEITRIHKQQSRWITMKWNHFKIDDTKSCGQHWDTGTVYTEPMD